MSIRKLEYAGLIVAFVAAASPAVSEIITSPSFFGPDATVIDFDAMPAGEITDQVSGLLFSSESYQNIGFADATDPDDLTGRFDAPMGIYGRFVGGGDPVSLPHYASGDAPLGINDEGENVSDMRIDFQDPQTAVAMWIIDNDYSDARLRFYDSNGGLLETVIIAEVAEGGRTYRGFATSESAISYLILDGNPGGAGGDNLDSTFIDNLAFVPISCPSDLDGDYTVGLSDLAQLLSNYGTTSGASYTDGDVDEDGDVDLVDLAILLAYYGTDCP